MILKMFTIIYSIYVGKMTNKCLNYILLLLFMSGNWLLT